MAKHQPEHYGAAAKTVFQPVFADKFLVDGIWYISAVCPTHGLVDEEVAWEEAKTPHHAGVIADSRHIECHHKQDEEIIAAVRKQEIEAAKAEVDRAEANVKRLKEEVKQAHARRESAGDPNEENLRQRELGILEAELVAHEHGVGEAKKRYQNTKRDNSA